MLQQFKSFSLKRTILIALVVFFSLKLHSQQIPLVYNVENTGINCPSPVLPDISELPLIRPLTDPFEWSDASGRDTTFENWYFRRAEIKAEIEHYEIGPKPTKPDTIKAFTQGDTAISITIIENGDTLNLYSTISLPDGDGPFPAVIALDFLTIPPEIFTDRNVAIINFFSSQVMAHTQNRGSEPINKLYPDLTFMGAYSAWPWGVSRLIDGIELLQDSLAIDLAHIAVSGCSYAGKMALFAGAFDERIALTIAQEPGGGGAAAWRVSETLGNVETLGATNNAWFIKDMFKFSGSKVSYLPHDHHELMAMVAPRALLVLGNPDMVWLAEESGYVSCRAAHEVWKTFDIADRFGFSILGGHGHCQLPTKQYPEVEAFVEKFLLGDSTVNTNYTLHQFNQVDYKRWYNWWGTGNPVFPEQLIGNTKTYEAECAIIGKNWYIFEDDSASNDTYIVSKPIEKAIKVEDILIESIIEIPFTLDTAGTYNIHLRLNCSDSDKDSFWYKINDGDFTKKVGLKTEGWEWKKFTEVDLEKGNHTLYISFVEAEGQIDKISLSSYLFYEPIKMGENAENICDPEISTVGINSKLQINGFKLGLCYPNPASGVAKISFELPSESHVLLNMHSILGRKSICLTNTNFKAGKNTIQFNTKKLPNGVYFYTITAGEYTKSKKIIISNN